MLVNDNCILEYLDLSYSGLSYSELNDILEAIPQESQLKCLYLGEGAIYTNGVDEKQKDRLAKWLNETSLDIAIVGAFSPNANNQDERGMLDNYYSKHIAKLADVAHTMQPEKSLYPYKQAESSRCANRFK